MLAAAANETPMLRRRNLHGEDNAITKLCNDLFQLRFQLGNNLRVSAQANLVTSFALSRAIPAYSALAKAYPNDTHKRMSPA